MRRLAFKMYLKEGQKEEYQRRHKRIWPELKQHLKDEGVGEYSIFLDEDTNILFAFQKLNGGSNSSDINRSELVKKWWSNMKDIIHTNSEDNFPVSIPLKEMFYLE